MRLLQLDLFGAAPLEVPLKDERLKSILIKKNKHALTYEVAIY